MDAVEQMEIDSSVLQPAEGESSRPGMPCEICVCPNVEMTEIFLQALNSLNIPFHFISDSVNCLILESKGPILLVSSEFTSNILSLHKPPFRRLLGTTALIELSGKLENLEMSPRVRIRPLFCHSMRNLVICITGFRNKDIKEELLHLVDLVKHMGGKIRKEMNYQVTHLIANCVSGEKYKYAYNFRVPVVTPEWVYNAWEKRFEVNFSADSPAFVNKYKLKLFQGTKVNFFGFCEEDEKNMAEMLRNNGGTISLTPDEPLTTHVVVDDSKVTCMPNVPLSSTFIVKSRWFWTSIQNSSCADESKYLFGKNFRTPDRAAKRKRIMEVVIEEPISSPRKSRKKKSDIDGQRFSCGSLLDYTTSPDNILASDELDDPLRPTSPRYQVFKELCQTESNYVSVLNVLIEHFKNPLEEKLNGDDCLLNQAELKIIFGDIVPIFETHCELLKDLRNVEQNFSDSTSIGELFVKYCPSFKKVYPPYINFFQDANELLKEKEKNSRFFAFLKLCYMNLRELHLPEIDKQTLPDLLIRPVQRLGSISLLLNDIMKNTSKASPDHQKLAEALEGIRTVMTYLNENKQRNDNQRSLFDIYQDIENCPPQLINSHRSFLLKCDAVELSSVLSNRGDCVTLFLFTDVVEVCKKRSRYMNILKSPKDANVSKLSLSTYKSHPAKHIEKTYKHLKMLSMTSIRKVYNVIDDKEEGGESDKNIFALKCRGSDEFLEKTYSFSVIDDSIDKLSFLKELSTQVGILYCMNSKSFIGNIKLSEANTVNIETSENSHSTISKALKYASKQVGRTFSLNRTPSTLRRVMSSMKVRAADT